MLRHNTWERCHVHQPGSWTPLGGRDAELPCVWRHGAGRERASEGRRCEEAAINTQGVCAYLSRTIKWKRHQCSNNGFIRYASPQSFPLRLPTKLHPRWVRHLRAESVRRCVESVKPPLRGAERLVSLRANRRGSAGPACCEEDCTLFAVLLLPNKWSITQGPTRIGAVDWSEATLLSCLCVLSQFLLSRLGWFCCYRAGSADSHCYEKMEMPTGSTDR